MFFNIFAHADGCPVDHENMSPEQIAALMSQYNSQSLPKDHRHQKKGASPEQTTPKPDQGSDLTQSTPDSSQTPNSQTSLSTSKPTLEKASATVYDVYGQKLDTANMMPATPNQLPSPGQKSPLSTDRARSTIPKSGADGDSSTWVYPSPQMFFNALKRKGKADGVTEADMPTVVAVHNRMNEGTWREVLQWEERFHCDECATPKLKRFMGRPNDLSPAARFRMWFRAYPRPFDRHDWVVDRCGLQDVRYIIDYYYRDGSGGDPIEIHVRPAIDSVSAAMDRMRAGMLHVRGAIGLPVPPPTAPASHATEHALRTPSTTHAAEHAAKSVPPSDTRSPTPEGALALVHGEELEAGEFEFLTQLTPAVVSEIANDVQKACKPAADTLATAGSDEQAREQAYISLNYCMARRVCGRQARNFMAALEGGKDPAPSYTAMADCLDRFQIMARRALQDAAGMPRLGPEFPAGVLPATSPSPSAIGSNTAAASNAE